MLVSVCLRASGVCVCAPVYMSDWLCAWERVGLCMDVLAYACARLCVRACVRVCARLPAGACASVRGCASVQVRVRRCARERARACACKCAWGLLAHVFVLHDVTSLETIQTSK